MKPATLLKQNDNLARIIIISLSVIVFAIVVLMGKYKLLIDVEYPFNRYLFAHIIGGLNSLVAVLLFVGLLQIKNKNVVGHRRTMLASIILSALFLVFYVLHHLSNPDTPFGGIGPVKYVYYTILLTHIFLAATILPFILFTAYRALSGQYENHKKMARYTWPLWLYVSISGVIVYLFVSPYYPV
jgi:putative membrane protein